MYPMLDFFSFQLCFVTTPKCYIQRKNSIISVTASHNRAMSATWWQVIGCFDWLLSGQQSVNPSREAISKVSSLRVQPSLGRLLNSYFCDFKY